MDDPDDARARLAGDRSILRDDGGRAAEWHRKRLDVGLSCAMRCTDDPGRAGEYWSLVANIPMYVVAVWRALGLSWEEVGDATGMTRQAAHKRWAADVDQQVRNREREWAGE